jgi:hypothetical protein
MVDYQQKCDSLDRQLPFDTLWLSHLILTDLFADGAEIARWIDSVQPFLKQWYDDCLSNPDNALLLTMARARSTDFTKDIMSRILSVHDGAAWNARFIRCHCNDLFLSESRRSLDFRQYTTVVACLVARHGDRCNAYRESEEEWQYPAVLLLMSVINDLENGYYFANLFGSGISALENGEGVMCEGGTEYDASNANTTAESLARTMQDLSVTADTTRLPDNGAPFSEEARFEDMQAMVSAFRMTDS